MQEIDRYYDRCPGCSQLMRIRELVSAEGIHFEEEDCSDCGHIFIIELAIGKEEQL